ncbi:MAG TPA: OmpA family protein, partial [Polyangiaceae bacterium]|nr:OmpA family protein [Polyangiaceae bacterium]
APFWRVVPFVVGGAGYWALMNDRAGDDSDPAFHFGGGVKLAANDDWSFRVDVRDNITNRRELTDTPNSLEISAGASLVLGREPESEPEDRDGDGYLDSADACPTQAGVAPDGCPLRDRDGDQIADGADRCPDEAGPAPLGCPTREAEADADPVRPGDTDHDGIADPDDRCPSEPETLNGFEDSDGCPDALPEAVQKFTGVIAGIEFDLNKDSIRSSSYAVLDEAAKILQEYPSLKVEISGHTDDTGEHDYNVSLSQKRADSVRAYLLSKGVDAERISTRGAGPDEPLVPEKTGAARQKNRRIEFKIQQ